MKFLIGLIFLACTFTTTMVLADEKSDAESECQSRAAQDGVSQDEMQSYIDGCMSDMGYGSDSGSDAAPPPSAE